MPTYPMFAGPVTIVILFINTVVNFQANPIRKNLTQAVVAHTVGFYTITLL